MDQWGHEPLAWNLILFATKVLTASAALDTFSKNPNFSEHHLQLWWQTLRPSQHENEAGCVCGGVGGVSGVLRSHCLYLPMLDENTDFLDSYFFYICISTLPMWHTTFVIKFAICFYLEQNL